MVMAWSVTSSSSSSNCASSAQFIEERSLPTISLDTAAADEQDLDTADERLAAVDEVTRDEVWESKRVPRAGHDRKKHASYRYAST